MSYKSNVEREANCQHKNRYVECGDCRQIFKLSKTELDYAAGRDEGMKEATIGFIGVNYQCMIEAGIEESKRERVRDCMLRWGFDKGYIKSDFGDDNKTQDIDKTPERQKSNKDSREKYT